jgi:DNA helicase-2/ATP-dependent DNA helicase PcrA
VAITRAKDRLYLLRAKNRTLYGESKDNAASQFLTDIPEELLDMPVRSQRSLSGNDLGYTPIPVEEYPGDAVELYDGDRVFHQSFGEGVVVAITPGVVTVSFKNIKYGVKKLAISIAPLKKLD